MHSSVDGADASITTVEGQLFALSGANKNSPDN